MALFGSSWKDEFNGDSYEDINIMSHWSNDNGYNDVYKSKKTTKEILDELDIKDIENYLRKKKLEQLKKI